MENQLRKNENSVTEEDSKAIEPQMSLCKLHFQKSLSKISLRSL